MQQTKKMSAVESFANTVFGFGISVLTYAIVMPILGYDTSMTENVIMVTVFSLISMVRNYIVRRAFTWIGQRNETTRTV